MSDTTSDGDKTIHVERRRTISLKRDTDTVRHYFDLGGNIVAMHHHCSMVLVAEQELTTNP